MDWTLEDIQKLYDQQAQKYKENTQDFEFPQGVFEKFQQCVVTGKILDVGCGYGREVERLRNNGFEAYGIDISSGLLDQAKENVKIFLKQGDIRYLQNYFSDESFDGVISSASIVHMSYIDAARVLSQVSKMLKSGGIFFISVKYRELDAPHHKLKESFSIPRAPKPYTYYNYEELSELLIKNNVYPFFHTVYEDREKWMIILAKK